MFWASNRAQRDNNAATFLCSLDLNRLFLSFNIIIVTLFASSGTCRECGRRITRTRSNSPWILHRFLLPNCPTARKRFRQSKGHRFNCWNNEVDLGKSEFLTQVTTILQRRLRSGWYRRNLQKRCHLWVRVKFSGFVSLYHTCKRKDIYFVLVVSVW
jgi:hypothetical protein